MSRADKLTENQKTFAEKIVFGNYQDIKLDGSNVPFTAEAQCYKATYNNNNNNECTRLAKDQLKNKKVQDYIKELQSQKNRHKIASANDILVKMSDIMNQSGSMKEAKVSDVLKACGMLADYYDMFKKTNVDSADSEVLDEIAMARDAYKEEFDVKT